VRRDVPANCGHIPPFFKPACISSKLFVDALCPHPIEGGQIRIQHYPQAPQHDYPVDNAVDYC
jgi:hypothetical protein